MTSCSTKHQKRARNEPLGTRRMQVKRHTTIIWDQVVIRVLFPSGIKWNRRYLLGGHTQDNSNELERALQALVLWSWGSVDPNTKALVWGQAISRAAERLVRAREAVQSGEFRPNREKDELMYVLENPEHGGCMRGYGAVPWLLSFEADRETYRSR